MKRRLPWSDKVRERELVEEWLMLGLARAVKRVYEQKLLLEKVAEVLAEEKVAKAVGIQAIGLLKKKEPVIAKIKEVMGRGQIKVVLEGDNEYPVKLSQMRNPPLGLFVRGKLVVNRPMVAVVGTRKPSSYGKTQTQKLVAGLVEAGVGIVSGLAYGIDVTAHEQTVVQKGVGVGVLGNGIDQIQPRFSAAVGEQLIMLGGGVCSEYPPGTPALRQNFPARNRIIAGLADAVVVVEGAVKSGSMITAQWARKEKRLLMAVPGRVGEEVAEAPNWLIKNGAILVTESDDILKALGVAGLKVDRQVDERLVPVLELLSKKPCTLDELMEGLKLEMGTVVELVSELELKGLVELGADGSYYLIL